MSTSRVSFLLENAAAAIGGSLAVTVSSSLAATLGTGLLKVTGCLANTPISQIVKPAAIGGAVGGAIMGTVAYSLFSTYEQDLIKGNPAEWLTAKHLREMIGADIMTSIGMGLLGQGILSMSGQPNPPMKEYLFALALGVCILDLLSVDALEHKENAAKKKVSAEFKC